MLKNYHDIHLLGSDASIVVKSDVDDDGIVYVHNRENVRKFEVDQVFGPSSTQQEVSILGKVALYK